jgi:hypothetical protein
MLENYKRRFTEEKATVDKKDTVDINPDAADPVFIVPRITPIDESRLQQIRHDYAYVLDMEEKTAKECRLTLKEFAEAMKKYLDINNPQIGLDYQLVNKFQTVRIHKPIMSRPYWQNNMIFQSR